MKTEEDIDVGSTVQLRAGSPKMTVRALLKRDGSVVSDEESILLQALLARAKQYIQTKQLIWRVE